MGRSPLADLAHKVFHDSDAAALYQSCAAVLQDAHAAIVVPVVQDVLEYVKVGHRKRIEEVAANGDETLFQPVGLRDCRRGGTMWGRSNTPPCSSGLARIMARMTSRWHTEVQGEFDVLGIEHCRDVQGGGPGEVRHGLGEQLGLVKVLGEVAEDVRVTVCA